MMIRIIMAIVLIGLLWLGTRNARLVPGRSQNVVELLLDFIRVQIAESILGAENGRKYLVFLTTIFCTILAMNVAGVIPLLNIAGSSVIGIPLVLALWVYVMYLGAGMRQHGVAHFLRANLFPPSVPWYMYPLITPIEGLQVFVLRPATLAIRLLSNMLAGHLMLVLCFSATHFLFLYASLALKPLGAVTLVAGIGITLFELLVSALQAFIFTLLAAVYINMAVAEEH